MKNKLHYYPTIVLGSTFAGLGAAYSDRENVLVIERTALVGYEFINSYKQGEGWNETILSGEGEKLKAELLERNILSVEGKVHIPAVAPVLYNKINKDKLNVLLLSDIVDISNAGDAFEIKVYNTSGFCYFRTDKIIDTRIENITPNLIKSKSINAMLWCEDDSIEIPVISSEVAELVKGKLKGEIILKLYLDTEDDWITARHKLYQFWSNRPDNLKPWTISAVANCFDMQLYEAPHRIGDNRLYLPSCEYSNPLEAFEAGFAANGRECE